MCRLFGLSASPERVDASFWLLEAPDSLVRQSWRNPDGTGLGWFGADGRPVVDREPLPAHADPAFARAARHVRSTTFLSHVRYATTGGRTVENTQPFALDGRLFGHHGVIGDLDELEWRVGADMGSVHGETDSERFFALVTREIRALGDVSAGIAAAVRWIAANLPLSSLNCVLATARELYAFRYPETHRLYVLERRAGGFHGNRELHHVSASLRVHAPQLAAHPSVVIASEPLDDSPDWRPVRSGELVHVAPDLTVMCSMIVDHRPLLQLGQPDTEEEHREQLEEHARG